MGTHFGRHQNLNWCLKTWIYNMFFTAFFKQLCISKLRSKRRDKNVVLCGTCMLRFIGQRSRFLKHVIQSIGSRHFRQKTMMDVRNKHWGFLPLTQFSGIKKKSHTHTLEHTVGPPHLPYDQYFTASVSNAIPHLELQTGCGCDWFKIWCKWLLRVVSTPVPCLVLVLYVYWMVSAHIHKVAMQS